MLSGQVALVTGASRGIGRGIALQLGEAGATVYVTGRQPSQSENQNLKSEKVSTLQKTADEITQRGGTGIAAYCDHSNESEIEALFKRIGDEQNGQLDILVNNAYAAVQTIMDNHGKKFYDCEPGMWDVVNNVGLRNHYFCTVYAARLMVKRGRGLIVNVSSAGGLRYLFNVPYGVGKAACDRMAGDCAAELRGAGVTCVSLWPGAVQTEMIMETVVGSDKVMMDDPNNPKVDMKEMFADGETIEYPGKAVVHLAADPNKMKKTGRVLLTTDLGSEYGFLDEGDRRPNSMRSIHDILMMMKWRRTAAVVPLWVKVPCWCLTLVGGKF